MATDVLVVLLNYRRPENVEAIIAALRRQTLRPRIAVWNNGDARPFPGVDALMESPENLHCIVRWHVAALLGREYVAILDDDLIPVRDDLLERCVRECQSYGDERILGKSGRRVGGAPRYYRDGTPPVGRPDDDSGNKYADIVKGRFMFLNVALLRQVPIHCPYYDGRGDDIWVSLRTARTRDFHVLPPFVSAGLESLPQGDVGLSRDSAHRRKRDRIIADMLRAGDVPWLRSRPWDSAAGRIRRAFARRIGR